MKDEADTGVEKGILGGGFLGCKSGVFIQGD